MITTLDLFSGIGGISLALERTGYFQTKAFCEIDPWCRRTLRRHWPDTPIFEDVTKLKGSEIGAIDLIAGGFPCQDVSITGNRAGLAGKRSGLWPDFQRLIGELRPRFALVENVTGLLNGERGAWMGQILADLAALRYDAEWFSLPAAAFGAPHWRWRVFILAYPNSERRKKCLLPPPPSAREAAAISVRACRKWALLAAGSTPASFSISWASRRPGHNKSRWKFCLRPPHRTVGPRHRTGRYGDL